MLCWTTFTYCHACYTVTICYNTTTLTLSLGLFVCYIISVACVTVTFGFHAFTLLQSVSVELVSLGLWSVSVLMFASWTIVTLFYTCNFVICYSTNHGMK